MPPRGATHKDPPSHVVGGPATIDYMMKAVHRGLAHITAQISFAQGKPCSGGSLHPMTNRCRYIVLVPSASIRYTSEWPSHCQYPVGID